MKHYNQLSFCQFFDVKPPRRNAKPPYWKLSGDGSASEMHSRRTRTRGFPVSLLWRMCTWYWRKSNAKEQFGRQT